MVHLRCELPCLPAITRTYEGSKEEARQPQQSLPAGWNQRRLVPDIPDHYLQT